MARTAKEYTIERTYRYHLYKCGEYYFIDYYNRPIIHGYNTLAAAREAIYYHFN